MTHPQEKPCTKCGDPKPLDDYSRRIDTRDGRASWCKECVATNTRRWNKTTRGRISHRLYDARERLTLAKKKVTRDQVEKLIAMCERELAAMDARTDKATQGATTR